MALAAFSSFGVGYAATRYAAELHRRDPVRLGQTLALSESAILGVGSTATFVLYLWFRLAFDSRSQRTGSWSSTGFGCAGDNLFLTGWLSEECAYRHGGQEGLRRRFDHRHARLLSDHSGPIASLRAKRRRGGDGIERRGERHHRSLPKSTGHSRNSVFACRSKVA